MFPALLPTYNRTDIAFVRGEGSYLFAEDGKRYLDFGSGIAVNAFGHGHPKLVAALFDEDINVDSVSVNYLEGLVWVFKYYTDKCVNWHWKYKYHYPPLLQDLTNAVGNYPCIDAKNGPLHPHTQLCFVLPQEYLQTILPSFPIENYAKYYNSDYTFEWAFCRYFWEAHLVIQNEMPLSDLLKIDEHNWNSCKTQNNKSHKNVVPNCRKKT